MLINGWIIIGAFVLFAVVLFIVGNVLDDKMEQLFKADQSSIRNLDNQFSGLNVQYYDLLNRLTTLENPPEPEPVTEQRLCPECNEQKEVAEGDYLCSDCRDQENIAA